MFQLNPVGAGTGPTTTGQSISAHTHTHTQTALRESGSIPLVRFVSQLHRRVSHRWPNLIQDHITIWSIQIKSTTGAKHIFPSTCSINQFRCFYPPNQIYNLVLNGSHGYSEALRPISGDNPASRTFRIRCFCMMRPGCSQTTCSCGGLCSSMGASEALRVNRLATRSFMARFARSASASCCFRTLFFSWAGCFNESVALGALSARAGAWACSLARCFRKRCWRRPRYSFDRLVLSTWASLPDIYEHPSNLAPLNSGGVRSRVDQQALDMCVRNDGVASRGEYVCTSQLGACPAMRLVCAGAQRSHC